MYILKSVLARLHPVLYIQIKYKLNYFVNMEICLNLNENYDYTKKFKEE